ncbi:GNAT family N-acetyltransferase [Apilactobacillus nanyangensis]|uniref:GNAT family N-acetyltransferase n=1 Tax=Apilactobacillus nanyangensis TaxID=2799579 RepID=A0ABT0I098_9LACO|nr:GNAT family N-acetyltransferase [Apilactobacillus nanyangensis]MCK8611994.1 GNAT family N-acetyltransferase [Apilactobacillus nanyangensis]
MNNIAEFKLDRQYYGLALAEEFMSTELYDIIKRDREELAKWLPWANDMQSINDEAEFIRYAKEHNMFVLAILNGAKPIGMINLHNIDEVNHTAEIGYWLSSEYQGKGIMYNSLQSLASYAFNFFDMEELIIKAKVENEKSKHVAERASFTFQKVEEPFAIYTKKKNG